MRKRTNYHNDIRSRQASSKQGLFASHHPSSRRVGRCGLAASGSSPRALTDGFIDVLICGYMAPLSRQPAAGCVDGRCCAVGFLHSLSMLLGLSS